MTQTWLVVLTFVTAVGCALVAGVFFAFSSFVMKALARLPASQGISAMQSINVWAVTPLFMATLFGTAATCLLLLAVGARGPEQPASGYLIAGSSSYVVGSILVTILFNVPRNNRLAAVDPSSVEAARFWTDYVRSWTAWNHVRTVAALIGAGLLMLALWQERA